MTAPTAFGGRILDTSALLDVASGGSIYLRVLINTALADGFTLAVPAAALSAAWAGGTPAGRLLIARLLDLPVAFVESLDARTARAVGVALPDRHGPLALAHVVAVARARGWLVVTAEPGPLLALAADVEAEILP